MDSILNKMLSIGIRITAALWLLGWFIIFLEIFRWHHMTMSLRFSGPPAIPGYPPPRAGGFLRGSAGLSVIAPLTCVALVILRFFVTPKRPLGVEK